MKVLFTFQSPSRHTICRILEFSFLIKSKVPLTSFVIFYFWSRGILPIFTMGQILDSIIIGYQHHSYFTVRRVSVWIIGSHGVIIGRLFYLCRYFVVLLCQSQLNYLERE